MFIRRCAWLTSSSCGISADVYQSIIAGIEEQKIREVIRDREIREEQIAAQRAQ
jgi:hypothetical protein